MNETERAAELLRAGGLVAFPTETVYGLGADATSGRAVARIYEAKGRPAFNPLIATVVDRPAAQALFFQRAVNLRHDNPVTRQLNASLLHYAAGPRFEPAVELSLAQVRGLFTR